MNWPRPAIVRQPPPPMDAFSSNILSRINAKQKEARADDKKNEQKKRVAARTAAAKAQEERRHKAANEASRLLAKSATPARSRGKKRGSASASAGPARKRKRRVPQEEPERTQPLPGMEFVARVARPKMSEQTKSSDYSDMFGPEYLIIGADVEVVNNLAKGSAEETAKVRREAEKKKQRNAQTRAMGEKLAKIEAAMRKAGELDKRKGREKLKRIREKVQASDWVAVDEPVSAFDTAGRPPRHSGPLTAADKQRAKNAVARSKAVQSSRKVADNAARKRALFERISKANGTTARPMEVARPKSVGRDVSRRERDEPRRRKSLPSARDRDQDRERERAADRKRGRRRDDRSESESEEEESESEDYRRSRKKAPERRKRNYSESEDEDDMDDDDSDSDDDGGFSSSFAALEEEEARSAWLGRLEDKQERSRELKRKKDKEAMKRKAGLY